MTNTNPTYPPLLLLGKDPERAAELLVQRLPADTTPIRGQTVEHVTLEVRRLARPGGMARTLTGSTTQELTGGVEVSARVPACAHDPVTGYLSGRMGPGWTTEQLKKRIVYMMQNAVAYYNLRCSRDGLYAYILKLQQECPADDVEMDMAEEEAVTGYHSALKEMDADDIKHWWGWLTTWSMGRVFY